MHVAVYSRAFCAFCFTLPRHVLRSRWLDCHCGCCSYVVAGLLRVYPLFFTLRFTFVLCVVGYAFTFAVTLLIVTPRCVYVVVTFVLRAVGWLPLRCSRIYYTFSLIPLYAFTRCLRWLRYAFTFPVYGYVCFTFRLVCLRLRYSRFALFPVLPSLCVRYVTFAFVCYAARCALQLFCTLIGYAFTHHTRYVVDYVAGFWIVCCLRFTLRLLC